ncbi:MAG: sigma-70 family RNA polymerase sigma factor [Thermoleophilaceae bacterium]
MAAFEILYDRHLPGVLSFSRHMLGSREEAEDAVQQAFASAHRDLMARDREINFKPWIYTIARNRCLSMLRAQHEDLPEDLERATAGLDAEVQDRADLRELVADLQDLPEDQRAALLLSEIRDLSHAEVAEVLGCKATQVKGLVHRARAGLLERRDARDADCEEIRVELAAARGGGFRRGRLRHHLNSCPACSTYREQVSQQRKMLAVVLPVVPSLGLKADVLAAIGLGGGAASGGLAAGSAAATGVGAGAAATGGGIATTATVAKIAAVAVIAGGSGIAGISAIDRGGPSRGPSLEKRVERPGQAPSDGGATGSSLPGLLRDALTAGGASAGDGTGSSPAARKSRGSGSFRARGRSNSGGSPAAKKVRFGNRAAEKRRAAPRGLEPDRAVAPAAHGPGGTVIRPKGGANLPPARAPRGSAPPVASVPSRPTRPKAQAIGKRRPPATIVP